jgi:hypothetical protein
MHGSLRQPPGNKSSSKEDAYGWVFVFLCLVAVIFADRHGMPQKWQAAIVGTFLPFAVVITTLRARWRHWSFWLSLGICFSVHIFIVFIFFEYVLINVQKLAILAWSPVALIEVFLLLIAVKRVEEKITGKPEVIRLS